MRALLYIVLLIVGVSCTTPRYIDRPYYVTNTEYRDIYVRDSIYKHDSIYMYIKGDTVFQERWHTKYVKKLRVDTFVRIDSVPVPYEVIREVNKLTKWQEIMQSLGYVGIGVILLLIGVIILKIYNKIRK